MEFDATFNNISAISWQLWSALLVEETGVPRENDRLDKVYRLSLYKNITPVDEKCNGDKISIALEIVDWEFVQYVSVEYSSQG